MGKDFFTKYTEDKKYQKKILEKFHILEENRLMKEKLKDIIEQANSINNRLANENQNLKTKISQQEKRIFDLENDPQIQISELKKKKVKIKKELRKLFQKKIKKLKDLQMLKKKLQINSKIFF